MKIIPRSIEAPSQTGSGRRLGGDSRHSTGLGGVWGGMEREAAETFAPLNLV